MRLLRNGNRWSELGVSSLQNRLGLIAMFFHERGRRRRIERRLERLCGVWRTASTVANVVRTTSHFREARFCKLRIAATHLRCTVTAMRTLVDLLDNEHGYARIFADMEGFSYELSTYRPRVIPDLFERMGGYRSMSDACAAAEQQLSSMLQAMSRRRRSSRRR